MFISERDRLSLDLFMADARTGAVIRKVVSTAADPHFDSLQYIGSAGAWDPSGRRFAMAAVSQGNPVRRDHALRSRASITPFNHPIPRPRFDQISRVAEDRFNV